MAIFPRIKLEKTLQVDDKTRLDGTKSYKSKDEAAITAVEIDPGDGAGYIDVYNADSDNWFLDYQYASAGDKTVQIRVTTDGSPTNVSTTLTVVTAAADYLFSNDADLVTHEPDILKWVTDGRDSFLNLHRRSQELIMAFLDEKGLTDSSGDRLTKAAIIDIEETRQWSTFLCLRLIFEGLSNAIDDIYSEKAKRYEKLEQQARNRFILRIDLDGDGDAEVGEGFLLSNVRIRRM